MSIRETRLISSFANAGRNSRICRRLEQPAPVSSMASSTLERAARQRLGRRPTADL